jgi:hypothetical protein
MDRKLIETVEGFDIYEDEFGIYGIFDGEAELDRTNTLNEARESARYFATLTGLSSMQTGNFLR